MPQGASAAGAGLAGPQERPHVIQSLEVVTSIKVFENPEDGEGGDLGFNASEGVRRSDRKGITGQKKGREKYQDMDKGV